MNFFPRQLGLCAFLGLGLGACGNVANAPSSVSVVLAPASLEATLASPAFGTRSSSGLVSEGFCYAFHVTAPDLDDPVVPIEPDTCGHAPGSFGKVYGPYAFGKTAVMVIPPGAARRFDLIGFKMPAGTTADCAGNLSVGVGPEKHVRATYDGVELDPDVGDGEIPDPAGSIYLFSRSEPVDLISGNQTVVLQPIEWSDRTYQGNVNSYPQRYGCKDYTPAQITMSSSPSNFGTSTGNMLYQLVTLTNSGTVSATALDFSGSNFGPGMNFIGGTYPGLGGNCGARLGGSQSCTLSLRFDPAQATGIPVSTGTLNLQYANGYQTLPATFPLMAVYDFAILGNSASVFSTTLVGNSSALTLSITNTGSIASVPLSFSLTSGDPSIDFSSGGFPGGASNPCSQGMVLAPAGSCNIGFTFTPLGPTPTSVTRTLEVRDGANLLLPVVLSGTKGP
ncbi:MAG: hypothetical protein ABIR96_13310 [Bdellovibrionota bacterium]